MQPQERGQVARTSRSGRLARALAPPVAIALFAGAPPRAPGAARARRAARMCATRGVTPTQLAGGAPLSVRARCWPPAPGAALAQASSSGRHGRHLLAANTGSGAEKQSTKLLVNPAASVISSSAAVGSVPANTSNATAPFVRVQGTQFVVGQPPTPYYFVGANYWAGMNLGSQGPGGDRARLVADLDHLVASGVTQLRVLGDTLGPNSEPWRIVPALQPCPGVYDPAVLDGFDFFIAEMGKRGMRATVVLGDEWHWSGGFLQYVKWAAAIASRSIAEPSKCDPMGVDAAGAPLQPNISSAEWRRSGFQGFSYPGPGQGDWSRWQADTAAFYTSGPAQQLWRDHVAFMLQHVNPYTGRPHRADPTIMAWQLANEPRAKDSNSDSAAAFVSWLASASAYVKGLAPLQLVCSGMEGDTKWFSTSQAVMLTQNASTLDYVTAHLWPMNWGWYSPTFTESQTDATLAVSLQYIRASVAEAAALLKPLVLEEFGLSRDDGSFAPGAGTARRDRFYSLVFGQVVQSAAVGGALAGANFWAWAGAGRPGALGVPADKSDGLCQTPSGGTGTLTGGPPSQIYWWDCFSSQDARPDHCPADTWWATEAAWPPGEYHGQDAFIGDPPHESQGWYSVYDSDNSTLAVLSAAAAQLNSTLTCARAAVATSLHGYSGGNGGAAACTSVVSPQPPSGGGNTFSALGCP